MDSFRKGQKGISLKEEGGSTRQQPLSRPGPPPHSPPDGHPDGGPALDVGPGGGSPSRRKAMSGGGISAGGPPGGELLGRLLLPGPALGVGLLQQEVLQLVVQLEMPAPQQRARRACGGPPESIYDCSVFDWGQFRRKVGREAGEAVWLLLNPYAENLGAFPGQWF